MAVEITRGGLAFKSDLDPTGFIRGGKQISKVEEEVRRKIEETNKAQKAWSDEALKGAQMAKYVSKVKILGTKEEIDAINILKRQQKELNALRDGATDKPSLKRYNQAIQETTAEITRMNNIGKAGFDEMGNKIEAVSKKSGGFKNALNGVWNGLKTVANILPGVGVAGLLAFAIDQITKYISSLDLFKSKVDETTEANNKLSTEMGSAGSAAAKATLEIEGMKQKFDLAKNGVIDKNSALTTYNETIGKTLGHANSLNEAEEKTLKNGNAYIELMFKKARAAAIMELYTKEMSEAAKEMAKNDDESVGYMLSGTKGKGSKDANGQTYFERIADQNRKEAAKPFEDRANAFKKLWLSSNEEISKFAKKNGLNIDEGKATVRGKEKVNLLSAQLRLQQQIDSLADEYTRKQMSREDAEIQAVRDKYKKLASEAEKFNSDPKNKKLGITVDITKLGNAKDAMIADLQYEQATAKQAIEFEKQKQLYADFEQYKTDFGKAAAEKRYGNEMDTQSTYLAQLQKAYTIAYAQNALSGGSKVTSERLALVSKELTAVEEEQKKRFNNLLKETMTYEQTRSVMVEGYQAKRAELEAKRAQDQITVLDAIHKEAIGKLDDENTQKLGAFKALFNGIEELSDAAAKKVIADAQSMLTKLVENGTISSEMAKQIADKLKDSTKALEDRLPKRLQSLSSELKNISQLVGDVDFGKWLSSIGDVVGGIGKMKEQMNTINSDWGKMSTLEKLSAGSGLFGAGMGIVSTVNNLFAKAEQKRQEQAEYATNIQLKQYEAMNKALERQIALIGKLYDTDKVTAYSEAQKKAAENQALFLSQLQGRSLLTGDEAIDKYIKANNTGYKFGNAQDRSVAAGIKDKYGSYDFAKASIEDLQRLLDGNKLDDATAKIVQNLIDAKKAAVDLDDALKVDLTRTNFDDLRQGIIDAVTSGADDASENLNNIFRKSLLAFLEDDPVLKTRIAKWYKDFAAAAENGLTSSEIADLKKQYLDITAYADEKKKELEQISGEILTENGNRKQGELSKGIQGITETTANRLEAEFGGLRLAFMQGLQNGVTNHAEIMAMNNRKMTALLAIQANTGRTADNTEQLVRLEKIEKSLASMDKKMIDTAAIKKGAGLP